MQGIDCATVQLPVNNFFCELVEHLAHLFAESSAVRMTKEQKEHTLWISAKIGAIVDSLPAKQRQGGAEPKRPVAPCGSDRFLQRLSCRLLDTCLDTTHLDDRDQMSSTLQLFCQYTDCSHRAPFASYHTCQDFGDRVSQLRSTLCTADHFDPVLHHDVADLTFWLLSCLNSIAAVCLTGNRGTEKARLDDKGGRRKQPQVAEEDRVLWAWLVELFVADTRPVSWLLSFCGAVLGSQRESSPTIKAAALKYLSTCAQLLHADALAARDGPESQVATASGIQHIELFSHLLAPCGQLLGTGSSKTNLKTVHNIVSTIDMSLSGPGALSSDISSSQVIIQPLFTLFLRIYYGSHEFDDRAELCCIVLCALTR